MWWKVTLAVIIGLICTMLFWIIVPIILVMIPIVFAVGTFIMSCLLAFLLINVVIAALSVEDEKPKEKDPLH